MTNLVNQHWINFNGEPVTGRTPPKTTVYGPPMTQQQQGEVAHTYKLFCDANNLAIGQYQVRNRTLADGTRIRCTSINGVDQVQVWTSGGGKKDFEYSGYLCGDVDGTKDFINILHPERDLFLHFDVSMQAGTVDWSSAIDTEFDAHRVTYTPGFLRRHYFPGLRACLDYHAIGLADGEVRLPPTAKKYGDGLQNVFYRGCRIIAPHPVIAACRFGNGFLALCFVDDTEVAPDSRLEFYFIPALAKKIDKKIADTKKLHSLTIDTPSDWQAVGEVGIKPYDDTVTLGGSWAFNASGTIAATVGFSLDQVGENRAVNSHLVRCSISADSNGAPVVGAAETTALPNTLSRISVKTKTEGGGHVLDNYYLQTQAVVVADKSYHWIYGRISGTIRYLGPFLTQIEAYQAWEDAGGRIGAGDLGGVYGAYNKSYVVDGRTLYSNIDFPSTATHIPVSVDFVANSERFLNLSMTFLSDDTSWNPAATYRELTLTGSDYFRPDPIPEPEWPRHDCYSGLPSGKKSVSFGNNYRIRVALCVTEDPEDVGDELVFAETNAEYLEIESWRVVLKKKDGSPPEPISGSYYRTDSHSLVSDDYTEELRFAGLIDSVSVKHLDIRNSFAVFEKTTRSISSPTTTTDGPIDVDNNQFVVAMETFMNDPGESSEIAAKEPELIEYEWSSARSAATALLNFPYFTFDDYPKSTYLPLTFLDMISFSDSTQVAAALNRFSRLRRITFDGETYIDMKHMGETVPIKKRFDAASQELLTPIKVI